MPSSVLWETALKNHQQVSWNIDCLDPANKPARVEEVCAMLLGAEEHRLPDVIHLQACIRLKTLAC